MKHAQRNGYFLMVLLAGLSGAVAEARPLPPPLDQEEYLDADDWFQYGLALNSAAKYREAAEAFQRSLDVEPQNPLSWLNLGTAQALLGDLDQAIVALRKALELNPKLALGYANLGEVYFRTERYREALKTYSALIEFWPDDPNAHYKRGLTYLYLNEPGKAQGDYLLLKMLDPELAGKLQQSMYLAAPK